MSGTGADNKPVVQVIQLEDLKDKLVLLATPTAGPSPAEHTGLKIFELSVGLIRSLAWPLLLIILIFLYQDSIRETIDELPILVSRAQKLSVPGLSLEIETQALHKGGVGLARVLNKLSPKDIEQLLLTGPHTIQIVGTADSQDEYTLPNQAIMESLGRLENKGLIRFKNDEHEISFREFESKFRRLPWAKITDQDKMVDPERVKFRLARPLSEEQRSLLLKTDYAVTDSGRTALDSIMTAIAQQLPPGRNKQ